MARIYIADDDADIRNLLTLSLLEEGHEVLAAKDGETALESMLDDQPDLLILDIMMPRMDGFQVLDGLRTYGLHQGLKVLILTARGTESDRIKGLQGGAHRYLGKPFEPEEFLAAVRDLLGSSPEEAGARREEELQKARLLATLESVFEETRPQ